MTKERLKSPRARLFVALELPAESLAGIEGWANAELTDPALRRLPAESLHVTLLFLGYRPVKEVDAIAVALRRLRAPAPSLDLLDPVQRPPRGSPRLFALPVESPGVVELQAELERMFVGEGLYEPEKRRFWPHLTVARVRPEGRGSKRPRHVGDPPGPLPDATWRTGVRAVRASLYRSELKPRGAHYTSLAHVDLSPPGQQ